MIKHIEVNAWEPLEVGKVPALLPHQLPAVTTSPVAPVLTVLLGHGPH